MTAELRPDGAEQDLADEIDDIIPSHGYRKVPVVALGGSAGSIEALQAFLGAMPPQSGLAFVVVIHLAADHDSALTDVLQRCTRMPVVKVEGTLQVDPDTVYVIPPGKTLQSEHGRLRLGDIPFGPTRHVVVDVFFRTLADSHGAHAAAVVLSGMDDDGALGIKRVKERGGLTVAQDPEQALHGSMPRAAMSTGMVDWVLRVEEMPERLLTYFRMEKSVALPPEEAAAASDGHDPTDEDRLRDVLGFLRARTNRDFSQYKRATVLRRIGRRMQVNGVQNLQAYLGVLHARPGESIALLQDLLISVTNFFRDADAFAALQQHVPALFEGKRPNDAVRVWSIACATGEEAYSLAMLLSEHARTLEAPPLIQVFATDLDQEAVQAAREGLYPAAIVADVSEERLRNFFTKEHAGYRVRRELREMVLFAVHDVLRDSPFSRLALVSCRNLLIYLTREAQARIFDTVHFALVPHGKLLLGGSEAIDEASPLFALVDKAHRIYAQRPTRRSSLPLPLPLGSVVRRAMDSLLPGPDGARAVARSTDPAPGLAVVAPAAPSSRPRDATHHASWAELHLQLLERLAPPSVLVNADYDIVHLSPSAGRFLQMAGGEPSRNLLRALQPELRIDLRAALYQSQEGNEVRLPPMPIAMTGGTVVAALRVLPVQQGGEALYLVLFEVQEGAGESGEERTARLHADPLARHLDAEIERLKLQLRETVEQYEGSTEELKASNEELQAMNEELRAATEELETSREELQSINEELSTVNTELKSSVEQLSHTNSDMLNLMDATAIATVFVARDLRIMRYTPAAVGLFNLIPSDIGRPLTDLGSRLDYPQLGADAARVLERLVPIEREVGRPDGGWYLARLMPYRTLDDRIGGVVLTFIDISERRKAEEMRLWLAAVVSSTTDAIISFGPDGRILSWNTGARKLYGYTVDEAIGQPLAMLAPQRLVDHGELVEAVLAGRSFENHETVRRRRDGSEVQVALNVTPVRDGQGGVIAGTVTARDITSRLAASEALRQSEERMRMVVENALDYAIFSTDLDRRVTTWNSGAERLLGYGEAEIMGQPVDLIFTPEDRAADMPEKETRTARRKGRASDERMHMRKDGSRFRGTGTMMLMRNQDHEPIGFVKILRDLGDPRPEPE
ncbi:MAG: signal transduction histidine kinase with CheB and CheR [Ramlibacter sp.]|uniref:CheR family methyltransferase n=1 Tax=Ramlibacter sp. TaxID=1917967 RepID=UPI0026303905|nr:CheR family methyltransferase [Ramlibacter sp.]MDB5750609.1 signal transduction histidine kinase with CheB and CheR [Ramlibacter sp.]